MNKKNWQINNAKIILPEKSLPGGCQISKGEISKLLGPNETLPDQLSLNLNGLALYPGLINAHDTLMATYHPFRGENTPYHNWLAWDNELKSSDLFKERMLLEIEQLYLLGAYKNILGGSTTVVDHIPHFVRKKIGESLPVTLLPDFGISHSVCSYALNWGEGIRKEYDRAEKSGLPYITHIAEGNDRESVESLTILEEKSGLGENSVLVHGLSLSDTDLEKIADAGASLVWCPSVNMHLYHKTMPIQSAFKHGINVTLGTDSAMSGSTNLLNEMRFAADYYQKEYGESLSDRKLFEMVTVNSARAFKMEGRGMIAEKCAADLLILANKDAGDPYRALLEARPEDIYLLVRDGNPLFGAEELEPIFQEMEIATDKIIVNGTRKIICGGIRNLLDSIVAVTGIRREFPFLPVN